MVFYHMNIYCVSHIALNVGKPYYISANTSPKIIVNSVFNVTVDTESTLTVTTSDAEDDVVKLTLDSTLPDDATFDAATGVFTWTPASADAVNIT